MAGRLCRILRWGRRGSRTMTAGPLPPFGGETERGGGRRCGPHLSPLPSLPRKGGGVASAPRTGGREILFWLASRGHHADVGGTAPGSMTPRAVTVDEEGVLIDNFKLVDRGAFREQELHTLLTDHPYPCRNPAQNIADLKAQIAAN